jgi:ribosomal protein S27E
MIYVKCPACGNELEFFGLDGIQECEVCNKKFELEVIPKEHLSR